jgi:uncharacterized protein (DUF4415 family)
MDATTDEEIARQIAEDPDTPPEMTDEQFERAEVWHGDRFVRTVGRPKGSGKKELVSLRIDRDLIAHFRAGGPGWQTRLNDTLREATTPRRRARRVERARAATPKRTLRAIMLAGALGMRPITRGKLLRTKAAKRRGRSKPGGAGIRLRSPPGPRLSPKKESGK